MFGLFFCTWKHVDLAHVEDTLVKYILCSKKYDSNVASQVTAGKSTDWDPDHISLKCDVGWRFSTSNFLGWRWKERGLEIRVGCGLELTNIALRPLEKEIPPNQQDGDKDH